MVWIELTIWAAMTIGSAARCGGVSATALYGDVEGARSSHRRSRSDAERADVHHRSHVQA